MKTSGRKKLSSARDFRWGFCLVMLFMLGVTVFMTVSAGNRFSGTAWGNLVDYSEDLSVDGFMSLDLSDTLDAEGASDSGASRTAFAAQLSVKTNPDMRRGSEGFKQRDVDLFTSDNLQLPSAEIDLSAKIPDEVAGQKSLPMLLSEATVDFGPLPKDLSDFESIVLNTTDDGLRLPDDSLGDLPDMELPDEDIILAEEGPSWKEHVVKAGETLSDIAMQYTGITAQDILRSNGLKDANRLSAQQIILVPNSPEFIEDTLEEVRTRKARVAALREEVLPLKVASYVVAQGDSLWSIANSQNLEVDTLVGSNTFKSSSVLRPGVVLRIPNQDGFFYKFLKGDTIETVAKRYQVAMDKIRKVNPTIDLVSLKAGSEIFLPGARPEAIAETKVASSGSSGSKKTGGKQQEATVSGGKTSRAYRWPVMGKINSPFGWRRHPITKRRDFHTGLDIKAGMGTGIRSAREGRVAYAGWMAGYGKVVVVEHNGGQSTLYAHCSSLLARQGAQVTSGQTIAKVGMTGRTTGAHLHFEVRNGNSPVNPLKYLR